VDSYSITDIAQMLRISYKSAWRLCRAGRIPSIHVGKYVLVPVPAWNAWLDGLTAQALANVKPTSERTAKKAS
jgi:hypothetical protein